MIPVRINFFRNAAPDKIKPHPKERTKIKKDLLSIKLYYCYL